MAKKKKKIKFKTKNIIILVLILFFLISSINLLFKQVSKNIIQGKADAYIASTDYVVPLYNTNFEEKMTITRGTKVVLYEFEVKNKIKDEKSGEVIKTEVYRKIKYDKKDYLIMPENVTDTYEKSVQEKTLYVRTPVSVYENPDKIKLLSLIKKGEELEILGFNTLLSDGKVNMYKIKYDNITGYVYSKYLLNTKELALANYDATDSYKIHFNRGDRWGGGNAGTLDFYPVEKKQFENNKMPDEVRSLYLNSGVLGNVDAYIKLAKNNNINAFVVDIKDNTAPGYPSLAMKEFSPTNYAKAINTLDGYRNAIKKLKDNGFYVIGRITVFKDSYYVTDHPESAITSASTGKPFNHNGSFWPSAFNRGVWEFNVSLAIDAVKEMGFNEIQFDYVRFPDRTNSVEAAGLVNMKNKYNESKAQTIQAFLMYATDELHKLEVYVSVDVFGESANSYVTAYGQYWGAISNVVDVISAMPYPDHFNRYEYGFKVPVWTIPYDLLYAWGQNAAQRQKEVPTPAVARTWIQAYNAIHDPYITYDATKISEQIKGLYDAGLTGGYMTWNGKSNTSKYNEIASAFRKDYLN
ncbi:MAG: putative glycoside hydrolase [Bacilli bacterium]|nr:putative glycoside hydrolase [Bacilli bacterium]MDD4809287.1 putative glycoside hydrolase [Bacilli bacterium]